LTPIGIMKKFKDYNPTQIMLLPPSTAAGRRLVMQLMLTDAETAAGRLGLRVGFKPPSQGRCVPSSLISRMILMMLTKVNTIH